MREKKRILKKVGRRRRVTLWKMQGNGGERAYIWKFAGQMFQKRGKTGPLCAVNQAGKGGSGAVPWRRQGVREGGLGQKRASGREARGSRKRKNARNVQARGNRAGGRGAA